MDNLFEIVDISKELQSQLKGIKGKILTYLVRTSDLVETLSKVNLDT